MVGAGESQHAGMHFRMASMLLVLQVYVVGPAAGCRCRACLRQGELSGQARHRPPVRHA